MNKNNLILLEFIYFTKQTQYSHKQLLQLENASSLLLIRYKLLLNYITVLCS